MKLFNLIIFSFGTLIFLTLSKNVMAASLTSANDTLSTSRPSASAPISADQAANDAQVTVIDNGSFYLASDSAKLLSDIGQVENDFSIASMSAANTPSAGIRTVYFASNPATAHHKGTPLVVPITAMHTITFVPNQTIPSGGNILISLPGGADNTASPSATTFAFNNLQTANVVSNPAGACNSISISAPTITCTTNTSLASGTTVTILIGCSAQSSGACTAEEPTLINPTKAATSGTADIWKVSITTRDGSNNVLDSSTVSIGIIESVIVRANIDPSLTFTISGIANGTAINNGNTTGCLETELTNTGINATATEINLGTLSNSPTSTNTTVKNIAAQLLTVSTNGANGYVLTATSSGPLKNASTGYFLNSNTTPQAFPSNGGNFFGIHACGLNTYTAGVPASGIQPRPIPTAIPISEALPAISVSMVGLLQHLQLLFHQNQLAQLVILLLPVTG